MFVFYNRMNALRTDPMSCHIDDYCLVFNPFLGIIMVGVIIGSKWLGINPDNVATPMAAGIGDLITVALLACFSQWSYSIIGKER